MGEIQNQSFQLSFNASLRVDFQGSRVTSDSGLVPVEDSSLGRLSPVPAPGPSQSRKVCWNPPRDV